MVYWWAVLPWLLCMLSVVLGEHLYTWSLCLTDLYLQTLMSALRLGHAVMNAPTDEVPSSVSVLMDTSLSLMGELVK